MVRAGRHDIGTYLDLAAAFADATDAGGGQPRSPHGWATSRAAIADASQQRAPSRPGCARFRPGARRIGIEPKPATRDDMNSRRGTLLGAARQRSGRSSSARARWPSGTSTNPASLPPTLVGAGAAGRRRRRRRRALRSIHRRDAGGAQRRRRSTTASSTRWRRSAIRRCARTLQFAARRKCGRRTRRCCWGSCWVAGTRQGVGLRQGEWPALTAKARQRFQGIPAIVTGSARSVRRSARRDQGVLRRAPGGRIRPAAAAGPPRTDRDSTVVKARQSPAFAKVAVGANVALV